MAAAVACHRRLALPTRPILRPAPIQAPPTPATAKQVRSQFGAAHIPLRPTCIPVLGKYQTPPTLTTHNTLFK